MKRNILLGILIALNLAIIAVAIHAMGLRGLLNFIMLSVRSVG
jgi:hypothetical protein